MARVDDLADELDQMAAFGLGAGLNEAAEALRRLGELEREMERMRETMRIIASGSPLWREHARQALEQPIASPDEEGGK